MLSCEEIMFFVIYLSTCEIVVYAAFTFSYATLKNVIMVYHGTAVGFKTFSIAGSSSFSVVSKPVFLF